MEAEEFSHWYPDPHNQYPGIGEHFFVFNLFTRSLPHNQSDSLQILSCLVVNCISQIAHWTCTIISYTVV